MILTNRELNSSKAFSGVSDSEAVATETIVRLLEDAIKDVQRRNSVEIEDGNIRNDVIINGSLNRVSQTFYVE